MYIYIYIYIYTHTQVVVAGVVVTKAVFELIFLTMFGLSATDFGLSATDSWLIGNRFLALSSERCLFLGLSATDFGPVLL